MNNNFKIKINDNEPDLTSYKLSKEKFRKIETQLKNSKLSYENNQVIENEISSEKLIDDAIDYNNNRLTDFYKSKYSNQ